MELDLLIFKDHIIINFMDIPYYISQPAIFGQLDSFFKNDLFCAAHFITFSY